MELTNEQRRYLGLETVDSAWDRVEISNSIEPRHESGKVVLFFQTYYSSHFAGLEPLNEEELQRFLAQWIADTDETELKRIEIFAAAKRRHCKFRWFRLVSARRGSRLVIWLP